MPGRCRFAYYIIYHHIQGNDYIWTHDILMWYIIYTVNKMSFDPKSRKQPFHWHQNSCLLRCQNKNIVIACKVQKVINPISRVFVSLKQVITPQSPQILFHGFCFSIRFTFSKSYFKQKKRWVAPMPFLNPPFVTKFIPNATDAQA